MSTIIKGNSPNFANTVDRPATFNLDDLARRGNEFLDRARAEAKTILADANKEADSVRKQAELAGQKAAREAAERLLEQKVGQRVNTLMPALKTMADELKAAREAWIGQWEEKLLRLSIKLAEKLVRVELSRNPEVSQAWLREALELLPSSTKAIVRLNPADIETLGAHANRLARALDHAIQVEIAADDTVGRGECAVETRHGAIDQQIAAQLSRLEQELLG
jgi:flagellar biosynthesis/type III secretory pathway protein FliH